MGWKVTSFVESYIGDLDNVFAYSTTPTVLIRDRYLGILAYVCRIAVIFYIVFYQLIVRKSYQVQTPLTGSTKLSLVSPSVLGRWPYGGPYCTGVVASSLPPKLLAGYNISGNSSYSRSAGPPLPRLPCYRWDDANIGSVSIGGASDILIPT